MFSFPGTRISSSFSPKRPLLGLEWKRERNLCLSDLLNWPSPKAIYLGSFFASFCPRNPRDITMMQFHGLFLFFHFWLPHNIGSSDPSHSCDPSCRCGNTGSFNPLCWAGDRTCVLTLQRHRQSLGATARTPAIPHFEIKLPRKPTSMCLGFLPAIKTKMAIALMSYD